MIYCIMISMSLSAKIIMIIIVGEPKKIEYNNNIEVLRKKKKIQSEMSGTRWDW